MHECNAMQLLETEEKSTKNKEQWSQRKSNEAHYCSCTILFVFENKVDQFIFT